ncbi:MAG: hypothetical protein R3A79_16945 [Nannocystaceae bacterium]
MPSKRSLLPLAALLLGLVPLACAGADAPSTVPPAADASDEVAAEAVDDPALEGWDEAEAREAPAVAQASTGEGGPETITFDGEDADPELATQIRSAPKRPSIPAFRLFGTRPGDGPG